MLLNRNYPGPESIRRSVLDNGIKTLSYQNSATESVVVEGYVRAGALVEDQQKSGLANFAAELLTRGTREMDFDEIYEELESVGAALHFSGGRHLTEFSGSCLVEDLDLLLSLLSASLRQPTFPEKQIEAVRGEILTGLQIRDNDTSQMAALKFRELLYQNHPYGQSIDGYVDTVSRIRQEDLLQFHEAYYGPRDMVVTVVGGIESEDAAGKIEAVFGDWVKVQDSMPEVPDLDQPTSKIQTRVVMSQKSQTDIVLGWIGPRRSDPEYLNVSLANTILGVFGMMGRLGQKIREQHGLAYYAYSRLSGGLGPSPWYISTGVDPANVNLALETILEEVDRLCFETIPEEELADSLAYRKGSLPVGLETNSGLASVITDIELYNLGLDYLQKLPTTLDLLTAESVQAAAKRYLNTDKVAIAVAGP